MTQYFYQFLEPVSKELARTLKELEGAIYSSPRTMLTHSRTVIEALLEKVLIHEELECHPYDTIQERIYRLEDEELLSQELVNALHEIRKAGNKAAHDIREFRTSESLSSWEYLYTVIKWYVEVYASPDIELPSYIEPSIQSESSYDLEEMQIRLARLEELLVASTHEHQDDNKAPVTLEENRHRDEVSQALLEEEIEHEAPGLTVIHQVLFQDKAVKIPHFLRDAFLLPQRFEESEGFLLKLNEKQEARIMSELPRDLEALPQLPRRNDSHKAKLLEELDSFIQEEIRRRNLVKERPGELFLFYGGDQVIVTEELGKVEITNENFPGMPGLITQLNDYGIYHVKDLPKELVTIGKYQGVGKGRIKKFFDHIVDIQKATIEKQLEEV